MEIFSNTFSVASYFHTPKSFLYQLLPLFFFLAEREQGKVSSHIMDKKATLKLYFITLTA